MSLRKLKIDRFTSIPLVSHLHISRFSLLVFLLLYLVLAPYMTYVIRIVSPDIYWHAAALVKFLEAGSFPVPPAYPFILWLLSGFGNTLRPFLIGANIMLPLFMVLQVFIVYKFLTGYLLQKNALPTGQNKALLLLSIAFFLMAPINFGYETFYIGRIALNVWHNPTYIAMAPFALLLFIITPRFINKPDTYYESILVLGMVTLALKPSFLFAWIPAVFMYGFIMKSRSLRYLFRLGWPLMALGLLILLQYYIIYVLGLWENVAYVDMGVDDRSVEIGLSKAWHHLLEMGNISLLQSLVSSFLFPLFFFVLYGRSGAINEYTRLSLFILFFGMVFVVFFAEGGERVWEGNFFWTGYAANLMLFLACLANFIQIQQKRKFEEVKAYIFSFVFIMHVLSGIGYMVYILVTGRYA